MRKQIKAEEVFYNRITTLIRNQLIEDPNFKGSWGQPSWYERERKLNYNLFKEKGEYLLEEIENMKHLILWEEDEEK